MLSIILNAFAVYIDGLCPVNIDFDVCNYTDFGEYSVYVHLFVMYCINGVVCHSAYMLHKILAGKNCSELILKNLPIQIQ